MSEERVCTKHDKALVYHAAKGIWVCPECLYAALLSYEAQRATQKRYQQSEKFKQAQQRYRDTEKGKKAREKYFKSEKYRQRRREYNERLKESLAIARRASIERPRSLKPPEAVATSKLSQLIQDIREYIDSFGRAPSVSDVTEWSRDIYSTPITRTKAAELVEIAKQRGKT